MNRTFATLLFMGLASPTFWAQESAESRAIEARHAAMKAAIVQRTAALVEAENILYAALKKTLEDRRAEVLRDHQPKKTKTGDTLATASLTGKVFAITRGGDVKPALLAHVYLFPASYAINQWMLSNIRARNEFQVKVEAVLAGNPTDDPYYSAVVSENCRDLLSAVDKEIATEKTIEPDFGPDFGPAYNAETDETGGFNFFHIKPSDYQIVVRGQAGSNDVLWVDTVTIAGATENFKLHSVAKACQSE